jgi:HK97 family phage prohead protease
MPHERRYTRSGNPVRVESRADGKPTIVGYAAVFYDPNDPGTEYPMYDDLVERLMPGCFDRAMKEDDVRGMFNHEDSLLLGRTSSGTMRLSVDRRGLRYEIDPPDTQAARDLMELLRRGDVTGSSFSFSPDDTSYRDADGVYVIERNAVKLWDVGPVAFPAYTSTEAGLRAATPEQVERARREVADWRAMRDKGSTSARAWLLARARAVETILAE